MINTTVSKPLEIRGIHACGCGWRMIYAHKPTKREQNIDRANFNASICTKCESLGKTASK